LQPSGPSICLPAAGLELAGPAPRLNWLFWFCWNGGGLPKLLPVLTLLPKPVLVLLPKLPAGALLKPVPVLLKLPVPAGGGPLKLPDPCGLDPWVSVLAACSIMASAPAGLLAWLLKPPCCC